MGHNSKTIAFRDMSLVLQIYLVMMSKYSTLELIPLILFEWWAILKFLHNNDKDNINVVMTIALLFLQNRQAKNELHQYFLTLNPLIFNKYCIFNSLYMIVTHYQKKTMCFSVKILTDLCVSVQIKQITNFNRFVCFCTN